jgi:hypothetical protein
LSAGSDGVLTQTNAESVIDSKAAKSPGGMVIKSPFTKIFSPKRILPSTTTVISVATNL